MILSEKRSGIIVRNECSEIRFSKHYDVIVAGLGTAGSITTILSARKGLSVLGIDRLVCMGGMGTAGAVLGYYYGSRGGYFEEIDREVDALKNAVYIDGRRTSPDAKKYILEREAIDSGAVLSYESTITGVFIEKDKVCGIRWRDQSGEYSVGCSYLVDGTGDGDVCEIAGCATMWGRVLDERTQPFTSVKVMTAGTQITSTNHDSGLIDQRDPQALSRGIISSHAAHLEEKYGAQKRLLYMAPLIGIREGRRIHGEESVTLKDLFAGKVTKSPVFYAYSDLDKHDLDNALNSEELQDWAVASNLGATNITVPVPYGAMLPKGIDGLIVAGRCMSFDRDLSACVRMERDMQKAGEVAAEGIWLSKKHRCPLKDIPVNELRTNLRTTGCLDEQNNIGVKLDWVRNNVPALVVKWLQNHADIKKSLATLSPGIAIWSSRILGKPIVADLKKWLRESDELLRKHSAFALGLLREQDALPVLRDMVRSRDGVMLQDMRKHNQIRAVMSIYLAGKLVDIQLVDDLASIITDPAEIDNPIYHDASFVSARYADGSYNNIYFQFFSHSVMALLKIGDVHVSARGKIAGALQDAVASGAYISRITRNGPDSYEYRLAENIGSVIHRRIDTWK